MTLSIEERQRTIDLQLRVLGKLVFALVRTHPEREHALDEFSASVDRTVYDALARINAGQRIDVTEDDLVQMKALAAQYHHLLSGDSSA